MASPGELAIFAASAFAAVFAIVNPVGGVTWFAVLTEGYTKELKRRVIRRVVTVATATLFVFGLAGNYIFLLFNTSIPAFRIAGGILLFNIAFNMVKGERYKTQLTQQDEDDALQKEVVGVVPLGIPLFAGPGAITTVIVYMAEASSPFDPLKVLLVLVAIVATMLVSAVMLARAEPLFNRMGRMGAAAFSRIMGILLAAVAVQFVIIGMQGAIAQYFAPAFP